MKRPIALFLLAATAALGIATFGTSCKTLDDPSPHTQKVRSESHHSEIMHRHRRHNRR